MSYCHPTEACTEKIHPQPQAMSQRKTLIRTIVACASCLILFLQHFGLSIPLSIQGLIATTVQLFCGWPFYTRACADPKNSRDTLIAVAISIAYLYGFYLIFASGSQAIHFETSILLITFVLISRMKETQLKRQVDTQMDSIVAMQPEFARVKQGSDFIQTSSRAIQVGDLFMVKPQERIPADGYIEKGTSIIDESMLTGEESAVEKGAGSPIFAGTINHHSTIIGKATKVGSGTALDHIISVLREAQQSKAPFEDQIKTISALFIPLILSIALLTWAAWSFIAHKPLDGILNALSVLIIASPAVFKLAVSPVTTLACSKAASRGIFIKDAKALQTAQKIKKIVIDKANTVTEGILNVDKAAVPENYFPIIKTLCEHSKHPALRSILEFLNQQAVTSISSMMVFRTSPEGVSGYFDERKYFLGTVEFLSEHHSPIDKFKEPVKDEPGIFIAFGTEKLGLGYLTLSDQIKPHSKEALAALHSLGIETVLLSSGSKLATAKIAAELNFGRFEADVPPQDRVKYIEMAKREWKITAMIGDGVDNASALAAADIGFAIGSETDIAMDSASIGLAHSHLMGVIEAISLSQIAFKKMIQNLTFAYTYNIIGVSLALSGFLNPLFAAIAMVLSSIFVVSNALHLKKLPK